MRYIGLPRPARSCHANWTATKRRGAPAVELPEIGYWEQRLRTIGARIDATGDVLVGLVVSVAGGDVWVSGMESNAVRSQLGWQDVSYRVEGVGVNVPPEPGENGTWATRLRAVGWALDRDELPVREPCIMHRDPASWSARGSSATPAGKWPTGASAKQGC